MNLSNPLTGKNVNTWLLAARPKTLMIGAAPVVLGSSLAWQVGTFRWFPAIICLFFALLVQIGSNYANDYFDFVKGADTPDRKGFKRAVASGLVTPRAMKLATIIILSSAFLVGLALIYYAGWWLLIVGGLSILSAIAYTGGPYPLGYHGLGDLFVFIFFGLVAVTFTFYVQAQYFLPASIFVGIGGGLLAMNVLLVNNSRDIETDTRAGKKTLAVRFGLKFCHIQYTYSYFIALLMPPILIGMGYGYWVLLPYLTLILGIPLMVHFMKARDGNQFNKLLVSTTQLLSLYTILFSVGIALS